MTAQTAPHIPVMLQEVLATLQPVANENYVDGTFGAGGYSRAILQSANCQVTGIGRDPNILPHAEALTLAFPGRFALLTGRFSRMRELLVGAGVQAVNGVVLDLGVSSMQLDSASRGFSFRQDGPLDMRMGDSGPTAADLLERLDEVEIANILYTYGEERNSRRIARAIVQTRAETPLTSTRQLAELIARNNPGKHGKIHPATKSFQALRIAVNAELDELQAGLEAAEAMLAPGGRLVVVSFHSLEDRMVKQFLRLAAHHPSLGQDVLERETRPARFRLGKPEKIMAREEEAKANPRARSARLRWATRLQEGEAR